MNLQHILNESNIFSLSYYIGRYQNGEPVSVPLSTTITDLKTMVVDFFPSMAGLPFRFLKATGRQNILIPLEGSTMQDFKQLGLKKSALYVQVIISNKTLAFY